MTDSASLRVIRDTLADYCRSAIARDEATRILRLAGLSVKGTEEILDAADKNMTLKDDTKKGTKP